MPRTVFYLLYRNESVRDALIMIKVCANIWKGTMVRHRNVLCNSGSKYAALDTVLQASNDRVLRQQTWDRQLLAFIILLSLCPLFCYNMLQVLHIYFTLVFLLLKIHWSRVFYLNLMRNFNMSHFRISIIFGYFDVLVKHLHID